MGLRQCAACHWQMGTALLVDSADRWLQGKSGHRGVPRSYKSRTLQTNMHPIEGPSRLPWEVEDVVMHALQETMEAVEAENAEKEQLGTGKDYDRSLP